MDAGFNCHFHFCKKSQVASNAANSRLHRNRSGLDRANTSPGILFKIGQKLPSSILDRYKGRKSRNCKQQTTPKKMNDSRIANDLFSTGSFMIFNYLTIPSSKIILLPKEYMSNIPAGIRI